MTLGENQFDHADLTVNGISLHTVSAGEGPLVVFCHGFPESWYSWRHQLPAVAAAGFRAVAIDMRGYGRSDAPADVAAYSLSHLVADVVGVVTALGAADAVVVGHDWGAPVAWNCALMRPDVFRAVAALSVPYQAPTGCLPEGLTVGDLMRAKASDADYYRLYFQEPGVADAEINADLESFLRGFLYGISGDVVTDGVRESGWTGYFPRGETFIQQLPVPATMPGWITEDDIRIWVAELSRNGIRGGLNWYRNLDAMPAILAPFVGSAIRQPALYLAGEHDLIGGNTATALDRMHAEVPGLRDVRIYPRAGHWLPQERPDEVNAALLDFLRAL
jgi:pimeloyl-ACP methyl ester carboxylesterase